jgi:asparagine synthase (glutamine-hydrolysing)
MCGIVGYAGFEVSVEMLTRMRDSMQHRGPDDSGIWSSADRQVGLAHRRLSIIDLSPLGHQPMSDSTGSVHVVFNGEIYGFVALREQLRARGHSFRSSSDTEVIIEAYKEWGEAFPVHLTGMFAIALYDARVGALYLVRDRAGEKPLFVWHPSRGIAFSSELKGFFANPEFDRRLDREALEHYLAFGYVPRDLCMVLGVEKLLPGTWLRYDVASGHVHRQRYWELPPFDPRNSGSPEELTDGLRDVLGASVRRQLVADVPTGILLSGGLDSSLITALAAQSSPAPVRTFTVTFPGHAREDEAGFARIVARHFGTQHEELVATEASLSALPELVRQFDEPIADSSVIPMHMLSLLVRKHATVALGGDGGDELFGGYVTYSWMRRIATIQAMLPAFVKRAVRMAARSLPSGTRGRNYAIALGSRAFESLEHSNLLFDADWRRLLLAGGEARRTPASVRTELTNGAHSIVQAMLRVDFRSYMPDDVLVKVDRAAMLASLETRSPFLDASVIEFAFGRVPDALKVGPRNDRKVLPRMLAARLLPRELNLRRKQGFQIPLQSWFRGQLGTLIREVLRDADVSVLRQKAIADLFARQERSGNQLHRLYALTVFELWRRAWDIRT